MPIYPTTAISFTVQPASTTTPASPTVYVTSTGCNGATSTCITQIVPITRGSATSTFVAGTPVSLPFIPNSAMFDRTGSNEYFGVDSTAFGTKGAMLVAGGSSVSGLQNIAGKVLAISPDGSEVVFSDTADFPPTVFICSNCAGSSRTTTPVLISGATAAAFSPDSLKAYIVSGGPCPGTASAGCLVVFSKVDAVQNIPLTAAASDVAFIGNGILGYIAGGNPAGGAFLPTCGPNTAGALGNVNVSAQLLRPLPDGQSVLALSGPNLETVTADITGAASIGASGCPAPKGFLSVANTVNSAGNLGTSSFTPSQFFLSPDGMNAYILGAPSLPFVIQFNLASQTAFDISLVGNVTPLSASLSPAGDLLFVGANDGTVHVINTTSLADTEQVTLPFPQNSLCVGPGTPATQAPVTCNPDLVAVKP
jgi:WD40 repeat protein